MQPTDDTPKPENTTEPTPNTEATPVTEPVTTSTTPTVDSASVVTSSVKKKLPVMAIAALVAIVVLGGSAAAYFGIVVANKPENLWAKALTNTGKGYDRLVTYADSQKDTKGAKINGTFKFDSKDVVVDGTIDSKFYEKDSETKIDAGAVGQRFTLEALTHTTDTSANPDIYLRVNGLKGIDKVLGAEAAGAGEQFAAFDNQWYFIDHTLLDQVEKSATKSDSGIQNVKLQDVTDFARALGEPTKQYVFTDDASKAVFVVKQNVGKEKLDDRGAYHYKVGINKNHLKAYNQALCDKALSTKLYKAISSGKSEADLKRQCEDTKDLDSIKDTDTADVWVDTSTKLVRKITFNDPKVAGDFVSVGLNYNGGDEYPFYVTINASEDEPKGKATVGVTLNTKKNTATVKADFDGTDDGKAIKFTLNATIQPNNDKLEFKKPDGAKSLMELLGAFLGGSGESVLGANTTSAFDSLTL